ncbi:MAG TPA: hypothetical protein PKJ75_03075 [Methanosarcina vacuolata]|nr:hypothetical protein [Methanosarcina vacuolata]HPS89243.1 hypothetical protein [Methanosarcina vacuolata]
MSQITVKSAVFSIIDVVKNLVDKTSIATGLKSVINYQGQNM